MRKAQLREAKEEPSAFRFSLRRGRTGGLPRPFAKPAARPRRVQGFLFQSIARQGKQPLPGFHTLFFSFVLEVPFVGAKDKLPAGFGKKPGGRFQPAFAGKSRSCRRFVLARRHDARQPASPQAFVVRWEEKSRFLVLVQRRQFQYAA